MQIERPCAIVRMFWQCLPYMSPFQRNLPSTGAWPWSWPFEWAKVKCKYANRKITCHFLYVSSCNVCVKRSDAPWCCPADRWAAFQVVMCSPFQILNYLPNVVHWLPSRNPRTVGSSNPVTILSSIFQFKPPTYLRFCTVLYLVLFFVIHG